jgi:hypothetical protein
MISLKLHRTKTRYSKSCRRNWQVKVMNRLELDSVDGKSFFIGEKRDFLIFVQLIVG